MILPGEAYKRRKRAISLNNHAIAVSMTYLRLVGGPGGHGLLARLVVAAGGHACLRQHVVLVLERLRVPLFELLYELGLLAVDGLLGEADFLLVLLQLHEVLPVLLLEILEFSESLQLVLVDDLGLVGGARLLEPVRVGSDARVQRLLQRVLILFFGLLVQEALDIVNL